MKTMGIFEIKTKLSQVCDDVASTGESVLITKRGKPFVRIDPLGPSSSKGSSVWEAREQYLLEQDVTEELQLPERKIEEPFNPLYEEQ
jgi:prevent-host-death family protein